MTPINEVLFSTATGLWLAIALQRLGLWWKRTQHLPCPAWVVPAAKGVIWVRSICDSRGDRAAAVDGVKSEHGSRLRLARYVAAVVEPDPVPPLPINFLERAIRKTAVSAVAIASTVSVLVMAGDIVMATGLYLYGVGSLSSRRRRTFGLFVVAAGCLAPHFLGADYGAPPLDLFGDLTVLAGVGAAIWAIGEGTKLARVQRAGMAVAAAGTIMFLALDVFGLFLDGLSLIGVVLYMWSIWNLANLGRAIWRYRRSLVTT